MKRFFEMKTGVILVLALVLTVLAAAPANAQTPTVTEFQMPPTAFVTVDLDAGNPLDPFIVSLNGGGEVDASMLDARCVGYITQAPSLTITWSGVAEFVKAFYYSAQDPVLIVQGPDGSYLCNDDTNDLLLDPTITIEAPAAGEYKVWVGSFDEGQLIPGILVLTTRPEINLGTFDPGSLVDRGAIAEDLIESEDATLAVRPSDTLSQTKPLTITGEMTDTNSLAFTAVPLAVDQLPFTTTISVSGTEPAIGYDGVSDICNGLLEPMPSLVFDLLGDDDALDVFFDGGADSTLLVESPDGAVYCNDDSQRDAVANDDIDEDVNLNPLVSIHNAVSGRYYVYVGRLNADAPVNGVLTITNFGAATLPVLTEQGE